MQIRKWDVSTASNANDNNVEVTRSGDLIYVRDSSDPMAILIFYKERWKAFLEGVKLGEFDI